jgi:hypothetical protein
MKPLEDLRESSVYDGGLALRKPLGPFRNPRRSHPKISMGSCQNGASVEVQSTAALRRSLKG